MFTKMKDKKEKKTQTKTENIIAALHVDEMEYELSTKS